MQIFNKVIHDSFHLLYNNKVHPIVVNPFVTRVLHFRYCQLHDSLRIPDSGIFLANYQSC